MKSPFPGMDPYLEWHWGDVHASLTTYARDQLAGQLPPDLRVRVEEYVAVDEESGGSAAFVPDVRVEERRATARTSPIVEPTAAVGLAERVLVPLYVEPPTLRYLRVIDVRSGNRLVTAIEFLSPANKKGKKGRAAYRKKQRELTSAGANLVEIDLLRAGKYVLFAPQERVPLDFQGPYRICVFRATRPDVAEVLRVDLRRSLPTIGIPLRQGDPEVDLRLQELIDKCYENGQYDDIDYQREPVPPLRGDDTEWAHRLLKEKGRR
jgi:hypothetical protein